MIDITRWKDTIKRDIQQRNLSKDGAMGKKNPYDLLEEKRMR